MKLLILDSGHNEKVLGKQSPDKSLREWEFNNDMQYKIKTRAEQHGITVYLTNPNPSNKDEIGLSKRSQLANDYWKSQGKPQALFFSIHANAYGSGFNAARGTETYYASNASQNSKNACKYVQDEVYKCMKSLDSTVKNRGCKCSDFTVIYKSQMPSILEEYGFYTNKEDLKILKNNRNELAEATVKGLCRYFGITYKPLTNDQSKPSTPKYDHCILYGNDIDKWGAEMMGWHYKNCIVKHVDNHIAWEGTNLYVVGNPAEVKLKAMNTGEKFTALNGKDRYDTIKLCLQFIGKL